MAPVPAACAGGPARQALGSAPVWIAPRSRSTRRVRWFAAAGVTLVVAVAGGCARTSAPSAGTVWQRAASHEFARYGLVKALSCASPTFCVAAGGGPDAGSPTGEVGAVMYFGGSAWSAPQVVDHSGILKSVSCPTTTFCAALDDNSDLLLYEDSAWSRPSGALRTLVSASCWAFESCQLVGEVAGRGGSAEGVAVRMSPTSGGQSAVLGGGYLTSVSCTSASFCLAVGEAVPTGLRAPRRGIAIVFDGKSWSSTGVADPGAALASVSCVSSTFCVAVGGTPGGGGPGDAVVYEGGGQWAAPVTVIASKNLLSVSCASSTLCVAAGQTNQVFTYDGTSWRPSSALVPAGSSAELGPVSCPTTSFCLLNSSSGDFFTSGTS